MARKCAVPIRQIKRHYSRTASREPASKKTEGGREKRVPEHTVDDEPLSNSNATQATLYRSGRQAASAALNHWQDKRASRYCLRPT